MRDKELIAEALRWANGHPNRRSGELMRALADALAAVPDAALDAVARVRAIHAPEVVGVHEGYGEEVWCPTCKHHYPCPTVAALDGAPEPEVKP